MADARARGWGWPGEPGSAEDKKYQRDHITTITLNCGVKLRVRKEVAHLFKGFFDELETETGYSLADQGAPDDWGFNNRDIRGHPGVKSNHAWGLAVDGNSEENPMGPRRTNYPVDATERLAKKWHLFWGWLYENRPDSMHFEYLGTPQDVPHPTITAPEVPDVNDRQNQILENLEKRSAAQSEALADVQKRLERIEQGAGTNTGNAAGPAKWTIEVKEAS